MSDSAVVLFSGGSDSTMAAAIAAQRFRRIHLLTFLHRAMFFHDKIHVNVEHLQRVYPNSEFICHEEPITGTFLRLYFSQFPRRACRFRSMIVPWICASCKLTMHLRTVTFCKTHDVTHVYCGANKESAPVFPAQMPAIIGNVQEYYRSRGITYETPVYELDRTDHLLKELEIIDNDKLKDQHLIYSTQHTCPLGVLLHAHCRLYYKKVHGLDKYQMKACQMVREFLERVMAGKQEK